MLLVLVGLCVCPQVWGQSRKLQYRPYADLRHFHYGFFLGLHTESLDFQNNGYIDPETGRQWLVNNDRYDPAFTVGILGEWRLSSNFALRVLPSMHFGTKHLTFRDQGTGDKDYQEVKSTYVSVPLDIKFTPPRINNYRPYLIAGLNPVYDLTVKDQENLMVKPFNLMFEIGFGCDRYLPYFKFIPELKFCFGLLDILDTDRSALRDKSKLIYTQSVKSARTNMVVLTFYIE